MKTVLVSIFDRKGEIYFPIHQTKSPAVAIREFQSQCEDKNSPFNKFPNDYCLCIFGEMDNETAKFNLFKEPKILAEATNMIIKDEGEIINGKKN